ncbi:alpha/beta fold hydrolase [Micromonospora sp. WMMD1128]|uniref:alpha/beta hydrolase family protein n=1 Tax=unclassified Micromonospora TaxID=2617518 RepID=UPI00248C2EBF|nr:MULTISPECIES: alpha/beta fold hydrolase [unclassified Micromonospora]WBB71795.1 alpha/beta fold hydrolase [Micromonospora sp. WMMD1128]WFE34758.1 alpha/beta fold hydrolase [Micromonospora sp. WMMD975]
MSVEYAQEYVDVDGARIGVQVYPEPAGRSGAPVVVIWPAMGVRARYYRPFAAALREAGLAVIVADLRGTGESTPTPARTCRYGYAELAGDVGAVLDALKPRLDGRVRVLLGHSLGGQVAVLHQALHDAGRVDGLALVAVGLPWWRRYPGRRGWGVLPYTQGIAAAARLLGVWPGWGFGGRQARGVIRDWAHTARTGRFPALDGVDAEAAVRRIRTPVLAVSVDDDQYTPHDTLDHLCDKLTGAPVTRHRYTVAEAGAALDHFTWVRAAAPLAARVAAFADTLPTRIPGA